MPINRVVLAALRALSYRETDIKRSYKLRRSLQTWINYPFRKPLYEAWDYIIKSEGLAVPVRIFHPGQNNASAPVLLFFHGGGWVEGNIESYNDVCASMATLTGHRVVSVDYRLAPENPFPDGLNDCYAVARELFLHPDLLGVDPQQICLVGDSAGGNLAAAVSLKAKAEGEFLPRRQILIYPATHYDHGPNSPFASVHENGEDYLLTARKIEDYMQLYRRNAGDHLNPYFSPLLAEDLRGQPDTLIITAQYDPLRDEGEAYAKALAEAGNRCQLHCMEDALHGYFSLPPRFSLVKQSYEIINAFLKEGETSLDE